MTDDRLKHLEFVQAVIARQASNSFLVRGWSLTVVVALYGFALERSEYRLALLGVVTAAAFGFLDGYYLRQERRFRCLYEAVTRDSTVPSLSMDPSAFVTAYASWRSVLKSSPLLVFNVMQVMIGVVVMFVAAAASGPTV